MNRGAQPVKSSISDTRRMMRGKGEGGRKAVGRSPLLLASTNPDSRLSLGALCGKSPPLPIRVNQRQGEAESRVLSAESQSGTKLAAIRIPP
jgi:hypothetical protein